MNTKYFAQYFDNKEWKTISCHKYKQLCFQEPTRWERMELKSKPIQGIRYKVHTRSSSSKFCFNPGFCPSNLSVNRMTTTHELITEIISRLQVLNIKIGDFRCQIIPDSVIHEQEAVKIYCTEKKRVVKYIPDLLVRFSNDHNLVKHWGGQIAFEVNVTHGPDDTKRKHFQYLGIPLFEIDATKKLKFKYEGKDFDEEKLNSYKLDLENKLVNLIDVSIKYPTYSNRSLANQNYKLKEKNSELEQTLMEQEQVLNNALNDNNKQWSSRLTEEQRKYDELNRRYFASKNKGLFSKLLSALTREN